MQESWELLNFPGLRECGSHLPLKIGWSPWWHHFQWLTYVFIVKSVGLTCQWRFDDDHDAIMYVQWLTQSVCWSQPPVKIGWWSWWHHVQWLTYVFTVSLLVSPASGNLMMIMYVQWLRRTVSLLVSPASENWRMIMVTSCSVVDTGQTGVHSWHCLSSRSGWMLEKHYKAIEGRDDL